MRHTAGAKALSTGNRKALYPMADNHEEAANVTAFDALYTTNEIQKLKVLLPYIDPPMQKNLAVYIKYMELQYTMRYVHRHPFQISGCSISTDHKPDLQSLCLQLSLYSSPEEIRQLEQFRNILQTMKPFKKCRKHFLPYRKYFQIYPPHHLSKIMHPIRIMVSLAMPEHFL